MTSAFDVGAFLKTAMAQSSETEGEQPAAPTNFRVLEEDSDEDEEAFLANRRRANLLRALGKGKGKAPAGPSRHELLLNELPFVLPFETRVAVFREWLRIDREKLGLAPSFFHRGGARQRAVIRRGHVADDGFATLAGLGPALKGRLEIVRRRRADSTDSSAIRRRVRPRGSGHRRRRPVQGVSDRPVTRGVRHGPRALADEPGPRALPSAARLRDRLALPQLVLIPRPDHWQGGLRPDPRRRTVRQLLPQQVARSAELLCVLAMRGDNADARAVDDLASLDPELYDGLVKLKTYDGNVSDLGLTFSVDDEGAMAVEVLG